MAAKDEGEKETNGCTFQWNIENASHCWSVVKGEKIESPSFVADALKGTKWSLWLYPMAEKNENYVGIGLCRERDCNGPNFIEVSFQIALLGKDNSVLKECSTLKYSFKKDVACVIREFEVRENVFFVEKEMYLPEDTLKIQCTLWITHQELIQSQDLFAATVFKLKRLSLIWQINEVSSYIFDEENKIDDPFTGLDTMMEKEAVKMGLDLNSLDGLIYASCTMSLIDSKGKRGTSVYHNCLKDDPNIEESDYTSQMTENLKETKSRYFPNDVLSLEFVMTCVYLEHRKSGAELERDDSFKSNEKNTRKYGTKNTGALIDDLKTLFKDGLSSDTELRTSTQTFKAHKAILSARSPVFRSLFSSDMREKICGHVDIDDFENDTIDRMLLYMYTDSLEDLQLESAFELYKISDKYQISSLKSRCASFLKDCLCPSNACEMLILADLHSDDDLKGVVQDYILSQNKQFFRSQEWKDFMKIHIKLASDVMYQNMCRD